MARLSKFLFFLVLIPFLSEASTLMDAVDNASDHLAETLAESYSGHQFVLSVVNYHSGQKDQTAKLIETELYLALERRLPTVDLILLDESLVGISSHKTIKIKGIYAQKGRLITLRVQGISGIEGIIIAQTEVTYRLDEETRRTLVAVLNIDSDDLNQKQREAYSDIFRSSLNRIDKFDLASSARIDKMNPDEIQKVMKCSRDECATIIGEQLGVDRVISSSLRKIDDDYYSITAKIMDINDGSILISRSVEHAGSIRTLKDSLEKLALELADMDRVNYNESISASKLHGPVSKELPQPIKISESQSGWPWWYWVLGAAIIGGIAVAASANSSDDGESSGNSASDGSSNGGGTGGATVSW